MTNALEISGLSVNYGTSIRALTKVSLVVPERGFVSLLGSNGAGKSTTLKTVSGLLPFEGGWIVEGTVRFFGDDIAGIASHKLARRGMLHVREGRHVFAGMTVEENLLAATFALNGRKQTPGSFDEIYSYFPPLAGRRRTRAGFLSGGEQQMLAIGRALIGEPRLLLVDEASLGLAPIVAREIFTILARINRERGLTIFVVEQNAMLALRHSDYGYVLENGEVRLEGTAEALMDRDAISRRYLGAAAQPGAA